MDVQTLAIPVAFILLGVVVCLVLIRAAIRWTTRLALIVVVPMFGLVVWHAMDSYKGWPARIMPPEKTVVYAVVIVEPMPDDKGRIYLWLAPLDDANPRSVNPLKYLPEGREPRSYLLPYDRRLHEQLDRAKQMLRKGRQPVLSLPKGARIGVTTDGEEGPPGKGKRRGDGQNRDGAGHGFETGDAPKVYELPPIRPHEKYPE